MLYEQIGRNIHLRRRRLEMTQAQLAEQAGISLSFMGHIERGTRKLSVETLYNIALALACSADELLGIRSYKTRRDQSAREILSRVLQMVDEG